MTHMLKKIFESVFNSTDHQKIDSLVNFTATTEDEVQTCVKMKRKDSSNCREGITCAVQGRCRDFGEENTFQKLEEELPKGISPVDTVVTIKKGINNYFQVPVVNQSKHIVLRKNTNVGVFEYVKLVISLQVKQSTSCKSPSVIKATATPSDQILEEPSVTPPNKTNSEHQRRVVNTIDLSGLTTSEQVRTMLIEESEVFPTDDTDTDHNKMKIRLKDDIPCQATYNSLPRSLYQELKHYVEELLNRQWITISHSKCSSPVVAVRKKDGTL